MINTSSNKFVFSMWATIALISCVASVGIGLLAVDIVTYVIGECS